ncbi:MAG: YebC/PmpR family DNA-binding transcriptional regulator [Bacteroidales bacterium]|nr:YebC/PmpR family DNA-binding transcriptional regulator [Bacteroidales bacterium]MCF8391557.1 YebC/PmpR family DNA-binding transcriptional regulator [Bacteroidales bacterium]
MSGHSKWSTIKRKKGAADSKRGKIFSRIVKEISIAVKEGGPIPETNPRLRVAIANSKGVNMPKENIERAISKADKGGDSFQEISFEGYLPNGVAIFIECLSDNNNRTVSNIRAIFTKRGGNLGTNGSLSFLFERKGVITIAKGDIDPDELQMEIIDAGVEDFQIEDDVFVITTPLEDFGNVQKKLEELNIVAQNTELQRIPNETKVLPVDVAVKILKVIEEFEDDDDVQNVFHNVEVTDEIAEAM